VERLVVVPIARIGGRGRTLEACVAVVAAVLAIAIAKPWAALDGSSRGAPDRLPTGSAAGVASVSRAVAPGSTVAPAATATGAGAASGVCLSPQGWRLVVDQSLVGYRTRDWIAAVPAAASGPLDPAIPVLRVVATQVSALGYCAPSESAVAGELPRRMTIWQLVRGGGRAVPMLRTTVPVGGLGVAAAYPASASAVGPSPPADVRRALDWPPGRYILQVGAGNDGARDRWLTVALQPEP